MKLLGLCLLLTYPMCSEAEFSYFCQLSSGTSLCEGGRHKIVWIFLVEFTFYYYFYRFYFLQTVFSSEHQKQLPLYKITFHKILPSIGCNRVAGLLLLKLKIREYSAVLILLRTDWLFKNVELPFISHCLLKDNSPPFAGYVFFLSSHREDKYHFLSHLDSKIITLGSTLV